MSKPFRVAVVGDLHLRERELTGPEGQKAILDRVCDSIISSKPAVVLFAGDLAGVRVPHKASTEERNAIIMVLLRLRDSDLPIIVVRGNHDPRGEFDFLHLGVHYVEGPPRVVCAAGLKVAVIPWRDRTEFHAGVDYQTAWREELDAFWRETGAVDVVLTHAAVSGAIVRPGQPNLPTDDPKLTMEQLAPKGMAKAVFAGHYHHHQMLPGDTPGWYSGGVFYNEFGEPGPKGWLRWDSDSPGQAVLVDVAQPCRVVIDFDATTGEATSGGEPICDGDLACFGDAHVKVNVLHSGEAAHKKAASDFITDLTNEAFSVTVKRKSLVQAQMRDGSSEIVSAVTMVEKFSRWIGTQSPKPSKSVVTRAVELLEKMP